MLPGCRHEECVNGLAHAEKIKHFCPEYGNEEKDYSKKES